MVRRRASYSVDASSARGQMAMGPVCRPAVQQKTRRDKFSAERLAVLGRGGTG